jgi:hypothetical protein
MSTPSNEAFWPLLAVLIFLPVALIFCLQRPAHSALALIALLVMFSSSTWGQTEEENTLYARGTGLLHFSLVNLLLWVAVAAAAIRKWSQRSHSQPSMSLPASPFPRFLAAFGFLLLAHLVLGLMSGQSTLEVLGYSGLINVVNMALFSVLLLFALESERDRQRMLALLLSLAVARAVFGLTRYALWGGDSANPYRNFEKLDIRLVYFDIGDNYIAALGGFCIAWMLLMPGQNRGWLQRAGLFGLLIMQLATVVLSFRRSSLIGLALMFLVLLWHLPWQRRWLVLGAGLSGMLVAATTLMRERLQFSAKVPDFLASLLYDLGPNRGTEVSRFYELEAAAHSLDGHWLFGLGSWGSFQGDHSALEYHFGKFDFVHSGFGHLILKSGFAGLLLFIGLLTAFFVHYLKIRRHLRGQAALLADAGMAGFLFWLPTLLIGTPIIEFRSMLLLGLTLALPYLALPLVTSNHQARVGSYAAA